ncbi:MAG: response regulator [Candidatus Heimdallarchaeota archaeon]|nr:response regulator [Candidatus Heimdallarchaeota archaeon]
MGSRSSKIKTAWVVDSSQFFRRLETTYIAKAVKNCDVESFDINQALRNFKDDFYPDVLVIDIQQPKVNAVKLVNLLKDRRPEMDIVVCSAEARKNSKSLIGMTLINKPIMSMPLFMQTMKDIVENV